MPFSPEQFMAPENDPFQWAQLESQSSARQAAEISDQRREREQKRQFDEQQQRNLANDAVQREQFGQTMQLDQGRLQHEREKQAFAYQARIQEQMQEGMKLLYEAYIKGELPEEYDAAAAALAASHGLRGQPMGSPPPLAAAMAAAAGAVPPPPGAEPAAPAAPQAQPSPTETPVPVGSPPNTPMPTQEPAPPGRDALNPQEQADRQTVANGMTHFDSGSETDNASGANLAAAGEAAIMERTGVGQLGKTEAVAPPADKVVTSGAETSAQAAQAATPNLAQPVPLKPQEGTTAEQAKAIDKSNPVVEPKQEVVPKDMSELQRELEKQKPAVHVEELDRANTEEQIANSMRARVAAIDAMGLAPAQRAAAVNLAAAAHGLPPVPIPPPAVPDPGQPPEMQGVGAWDTALPTAVRNFAMAPPNIMPSVMRDLRTSGGQDFYNIETGEYAGTIKLNNLQEARVAHRMKIMKPLERMASNEKELRQIQSANEAFALSGDKEAYNVMTSMMRVGDASFFRGQTAQRMNQKDFVDVTDRMNDAAKDVVKLYFERHQLKDMNKAIKDSTGMLQALQNDPTNLDNRFAIVTLLKLAHGARATDADARLSLTDSFWTDMGKALSYYTENGKLPDEYMDQIQKVFNGINLRERKAQRVYAKSMYRDVRQEYFINEVNPAHAARLARQSIRQSFPLFPMESINRIASEVEAELEESGATDFGVPAPAPQRAPAPAPAQPTAPAQPAAPGQPVTAEQVREALRKRREKAAADKAAAEQKGQ